MAGAGPAVQPVPNMKTGAAPGAPCTNSVKFTFGWDANGNVLACRSPFPGESFKWVDGGTLIGVRDAGSQCILDTYGVSPDFRQFVSAQSPDGYGMYCSYPFNRWDVHPSA